MATGMLMKGTESVEGKVYKELCYERRDPDSGEVRYGAHLLPQKHQKKKKKSTGRTIGAEHLLNPGRRHETSRKGKKPST